MDHDNPTPSGEQQPPTAPMRQPEFEMHLNLLCQAALEGGLVSFGDVVAALEFAKAQTIDLAKAEAQREAQANRPRILTPNGGPPP